GCACGSTIPPPATSHSLTSSRKPPFVSSCISRGSISHHTGTVPACSTMGATSRADRTSTGVSLRSVDCPSQRQPGRTAVRPTGFLPILALRPEPAVQCCRPCRHRPLLLALPADNLGRIAGVAARQGGHLAELLGGGTGGHSELNGAVVAELP